LGHPILKTLESTPNQWLVQMLYAFNSGNIAEFSNIWNQKRQEIQAQVFFFFFSVASFSHFSNNLFVSLFLKNVISQF